MGTGRNAAVLPVLDCMREVVLLMTNLKERS